MARISGKEVVRIFGTRIHQVLETAHQKKVFTGTHIDVAKQLCRTAIEDFAQTYTKPGQFGALVGFPLNDMPHLCEFALADFQPEFKDKHTWFASMGSGQMITDPFLAFLREVFWESGPPSVSEGTFAVTWALQHVIRLNAGGINEPMMVAVMERDPSNKGKFKSRLLDSDDLQEHSDSIDAAKERLRTWPAQQLPGAAETPDVPQVE